MRYFVLSFLFITCTFFTATAQTPAPTAGEQLQPATAEELKRDYFNQEVYDKYHPQEIFKAWPIKIPRLTNLVGGTFKFTNNRSWYLPSEMTSPPYRYQRKTLIKYFSISMTFQIRPRFSGPTFKFSKPQ